MTIERPLRILVIGGLRGFTSTHLVRRAVEAGHRVTVLTRGALDRVQTEANLPAPPTQTEADLPAAVEVIVGDRFHDLAWTEGREWDAAVDFGAFFADDVEAIRSALGGRVGHYTLISSIATYRQDPGPLDEESALYEPSEPGLAAADEPSWIIRYARGKVEAEPAAARFDGGALVVRPGIIVGPRDRHGHLEFWCAKWASGGDVVVPGDPDDPVQFVDSRDLAAWLIDAIERQLRGTYNVVGPEEPLTMRDLLAIFAKQLGDRPITWLPSEWLTARGVRSELPCFWVKPDGVREPDEFWLSFRVSDARARANGFRTRDAEQTIRETVAAFEASADARSRRLEGWLGDADEGALLEAWRREARRSS